MSILVAGPEPITSRDDLVNYLASGEKPKSDWRIGTEHEKFGFALEDHTPLPYENGGGPSVRKMLEGLVAFGWTPIEERGDDRIQESGWHKWEWVAGLELTWMMLDHHAHTGVDAFARRTWRAPAKSAWTRRSHGMPCMRCG